MRMRGSAAADQVEVGARRSLRAQENVDSSHVPPASGGQDLRVLDVPQRLFAGDRCRRRTCSRIASSSSCMPWEAPVWRMDWIWKVLFSRIRLPTALVTTRVSNGGHAPGAVGPRQQALGDHRPQRLRDHRADLLLLVRRERAHQPVDGADRVLRVERRQHEVAGLGRGQREGDGLEIAQLTDHDHVRVLAQGGPQRARRRSSVWDLHAALVHEATLRRVDVLDRDPRS